MRCSSCTGRTRRGREQRSDDAARSHRRRSVAGRAAARRCRHARLGADGLSDAGRSASSCRSRRAAAPTCRRGSCSRTCRTCLGQPFIVENRAGAAGRIGTGVVAKSDPDGHTLLVSTESSLVIAPHIGQSIGYDPLKDFAPVSLLTRNTVMLVVHPSVPAQTLAGVHGAGARQARAVVLCLVRRRRAQPSGRRDFQPHHRPQDHPCAVPRHRARAYRR